MTARVKDTTLLIPGPAAGLRLALAPRLLADAARGHLAGRRHARPDRQGPAAASEGDKRQP